MTFAQWCVLKTACPALLTPNVLTTGRRFSLSRPSLLGLITGSWRLRDSGISASAIEVLGERGKRPTPLGTTRYMCHLVGFVDRTQPQTLHIVFFLLCPKATQCFSFKFIPVVAAIYVNYTHFSKLACYWYIDVEMLHVAHLHLIRLLLIWSQMLHD